MQLCPHCGQENREGEIYCATCGFALVAVPISTRQLEEGSAHSGTANLGSDGVLFLQVDPNEPPVVVKLHHSIILGRISNQVEDVAYVNLTPYGAEEKGVSRQHAQITRDGRAVYVSDLNSTNGTHLNGEMLSPSVEQRVHDGDELTLGKLKVFVYFKA